MTEADLHVIIVDDHPVVRAGVAGLLAAANDIEIVAQCTTGTEAIDAVRQHTPEVVLCDLRLGDGVDGVGVTAAVRALADPPAVVILTTYDHDLDLVRAVEAGAVGYLLKDADPADIIEAVRRAGRGETVLSEQLTARIVETMRRQRVHLSERELDVLRLVADGLSNRQIAGTLFLSEATVKTHLNHAFGKLGEHNRTAAIATARAAGLID